MLVKKFFLKVYNLFSKKETKEQINDNFFLSGWEPVLDYKKLIEEESKDYLIEIHKNSVLDENKRTAISHFLLQEYNKEPTFDENAYSLLFTKNTEIIAYIKIQFKDEEYVYLEFLTVKEEFRGKGIATHLLAYAINFCDKNYSGKKIFSWVDIEIANIFSIFGFNPFMGQIEEINERLVSLLFLSGDLSERPKFWQTLQETYNNEDFQK